MLALRPKAVASKPLAGFDRDGGNPPERNEWKRLFELEGPRFWCPG